MSNNLVTEYFLGVSTPEGFHFSLKDLYSPQNGWFCYILKGGPGTGKSTLMKKIAKTAQDKNLKVELFHCSSDPKSLDAVIMPEIKKCIIDGTAPHTVDPSFPGSCETIINLCECWDEKKLQKSRDNIINLCTQNTSYHQNAKTSLKVYREIFKSNHNIISSYINKEKLKSYCNKIATQLKPQLHLKEAETIRFISSITPNGYIFFENTITTLANKIFVIEDDYNVVSNEIIKNIKNKALSLNQRVITCPSPLDPQNILDAIIMPDIQTAYVAKNKKIAPNLFKNILHKKINTKKFLKTQELSKQKNIVKLQDKLCKTFLDSTIKHLQSALKIHDDIEKIYKSAMNYKKTNKFISKISLQLNNTYAAPFVRSTAPPK